MSSDLLAEFDSFYRAPQDKSTEAPPASNDLSFLSNTQSNSGQFGGSQQWQNTQSSDIWGTPSYGQSSTTTVPIVPEQDDIWGSFDAGNPAQSLRQKPAALTPNYGGAFGSTNQYSYPQQNESVPAPAPSVAVDPFSANLNMMHTNSSLNTNRIAPQRPAPVTESSYGEVLFDADDAAAEQEDDDEFGEFETVTPEPPQALDAMFGATSAKSSHYTEPSFDIKRETKQKPTAPVKAQPVPEKPKSRNTPSITKVEVDDDWGDFSDIQTPAVQSAKQFSGPEPDVWGWDEEQKPSTKAPVPEVISPPPTNIPPPSVLLSLYPQLFDLPQSALFKPVANQPFSLKNRIISDPSTIDFLRGYLLIATVAARIIAGRKLRWKRDNILAQSMKIGQAGGKGGMKLTGVDKAEVTREDREVADIARLWKEQLGKLRSTIAVANSSLHDSSQQLAIPDVSENMHVKTQAGGLTAPKPCLICGLKREERVNKVDFEVEDSFGEWWVEHWGHRACRNFWLEHESKLKHR